MQIRCWIALGIAALTLMGLAQSTAAACASASRFELFDRAQYVVVGTITTPLAKRNYRRRGHVTLEVQHVLKGNPQNTLKVRAEVGLCAAELAPGATALLFLTSQGDVVGDMEGYLELALPDGGGSAAALKHAHVRNEGSTEWIALLTRWTNASNDLAKLDLLIEHLADETTGLPRQAADYLTNAPRLLKRIDAARRKQIVTAIADDKWMPNYTILVLTRLRAPELGGLLDSRHWNYASDIRDLLAADVFGLESDRRLLARAMVLPTSSVSTRAAALDRCEMLRGESLYPYVGYLYRSPFVANEVDWEKLAKACANEDRPASTAASKKAGQPSQAS